MRRVSFSRRRGCGSSALFRREALILSGAREKHYPAKEWLERLARVGGRNIFGEPNFVPGWGWNFTKIGTVPRYVQTLDQWLLLRWIPPSVENFGTRQDWYAHPMEAGQLAESKAERFREEWPWRGDYEIHSTVPVGDPFDLRGAEYLIHRYLNRPKLPSVKQRDRDDRRALEAEALRREQEDYEMLQSSTRAFYGESFVGYGAKSAERDDQYQPAPPTPETVVRKIHEMAAARIARSEQIQGAA